MSERKPKKYNELKKIANFECYDFCVHIFSALKKNKFIIRNDEQSEIA